MRENALVHAHRKAGSRIEHQKSLTVRYDGVVVGDYNADLLVADEVLVERKATRAFDPAHVAQCIKYSKATTLRI